MDVPAESNPVRLNLGAGDKVFEGWTSVGLGDHHDIRADLRKLPLPDAFADEAMAIHVVEHINRWEVPAMLREWRRVLKPGALLIVELPDLLKCCRNVSLGRAPRLGVLGLFGDPNMQDELMMHRWGWTPEEMMTELRDAGFRKVKQRDPEFHGRKKDRDMRIEARA
jgi:predicted SAM-dependent methyltransferase